MSKALEVYGEQCEEACAIETAKRMIADNLPVEKVAKYSGLPLEKVKKLAEVKTA